MILPAHRRASSWLPSSTGGQAESRRRYLAGLTQTRCIVETKELVLWSRLIQAAAAVMLALSAVLLLAPAAGAAIFNIVYFHAPDAPVPFPPEAQRYIRFANGILGAVMAGWMVAVIVLARGPFLAAEPYAWKAIAGPLAFWFLVDTAYSMLHGVWGNVMLNVCTVAMFGIPLLASRRHFVAKS